MSSFASIDWRLRTLSLYINIEKGNMVQVLYGCRVVASGSADSCLKEIRDYMVFFDGSDKKVFFDIYDNTGGTPEGAELKNYCKNKLTMLASSLRAQTEVVAHMNIHYF